MPKKLLEADFVTADIQAIYSRATANNTNQNTNTATTSYDSGLTAKLTSIGFTDENIVKKLIGLGELFKNACEVLSFNVDNNPILAFVKQQYVQDKLIKTGLLNVNSFKAIYAAVSKKLIADSEFFNTKSYNIIYCPDLYRKPAKEMLGYLALQRSILKPSATSYDGKTQLKNRRTFLYIESEKESDADKYVEKVKAVELDDRTLPKVFGAKLNSLTVAEKINGSFTDEAKAITRSNEELAAIVKKLTSVEDKLAVILSLSTSTKSTKAQQAINTQEEFKEVSGQRVTKAFLKLAKENILPKGQLQTKTADMLVDMILATFKANEEADH